MPSILSFLQPRIATWPPPPQLWHWVRFHLCDFIHFKFFWWFCLSGMRAKNVELQVLVTLVILSMSGMLLYCICIFLFFCSCSHFSPSNYAYVKDPMVITLHLTYGWVNAKRAVSLVGQVFPKVSLCSRFDTGCRQLSISVALFGNWDKGYALPQKNHPLWSSADEKGVDSLATR